jgi:hypothetical protein
MPEIAKVEFPEVLKAHHEKKKDEIKVPIGSYLGRDGQVYRDPNFKFRDSGVSDLS